MTKSKKNISHENISHCLVVDYINQFPLDALDYVESLVLSQRHKILMSLDPVIGAKFFSMLSADCITALLKKYAVEYSNILNLLEYDVAARILKLLGKATQEKIIHLLTHQKQIENIMQYPANTAGALMETKLVSMHSNNTVLEALALIRKSKVKHMQNIYILDLEGVFLGLVPIQDLIVADDSIQVGALINSQIFTLNEMAVKEEVIELAETHKLMSIPVLDSAKHLVGVLRYNRLVSIIQKNSMVDMQKMVGVSQDETPLSSPLFSVKKRFPWLGINLLTTFLAAFIVGIFEPTIEKITALAVLLPIVAGQSGNTGAQAQVVAIRGLALREIHLHHKWRVLTKEALAGFFNGILISLLCMISVYIWSSSVALSLVIGASMVISMVAAGIFGAGVPLVLYALRQDPAVSSSIILTTFTDVFGFFSFLGLATVFSRFLVA